MRRALHLGDIPCLYIGLEEGVHRLQEAWYMGRRRAGHAWGMPRSPALRHWVLLGDGRVVRWRRTCTCCSTKQLQRASWRCPRSRCVVRGAVVKGPGAAMRCARTRQDLTPERAPFLRRRHTPGSALSSTVDTYWRVGVLVSDLGHLSHP